MTLLANMTPEFWSGLAEKGVTFILMAVAIRWLVVRGEKTDAASQASIKDLVTELHRERSERIDALETHVELCDTDRRELRDMLINHLSRQATVPAIAIATGAPPQQHANDNTRS